MTLSVFCDFDGTIASVDVTDSLLEAFAEPGWRDVEKEWQDGRIGSRECMRRQVELLAVTRETLDRHLDSITIDPYFPAFARDCEAAGVPLVVLSDGIDYAIRRILGRHDLGHLPIQANRLLMVDGRYSLRSPHARQACPQGTCKCASMTPSLDAGMRVLLIGDGTSDCCGARQADLVFAKYKLLDYCRRHALPHFPYETFSDARAMLASLLVPAGRNAVPAQSAYPLERIANA